MPDACAGNRVPPLLTSCLCGLFSCFVDRRCPSPENGSDQPVSDLSGPLPQIFTARSLQIAHMDSEEYWKWVSDERFTEVVELLKVWWLDIIARINLNQLSPETSYAAHLIFKTTSQSEGLGTFQEASVSMGSLQQKKDVCINPSVAVPPNVGLPVRRSDGWMELELGQFYCNDNTADQEVVVGLKETNDYNRKTGLVIAGVEVRPI